MLRHLPLPLRSKAWRDAVDRLEDFLKENHPDDVLVPIAPAAKRPAVSHKAPGAWSWQAWAQWKADTSSFDVGILLRSLVVIDVDSESIALDLEKRFDVLTGAPMARTRRGRHYYFARSRRCDLEGYFDARSPVIPGVDFKTRTSSGTAGVIVAAPSTDKVWQRAPWSPEARMMIPEIPDDLLAAVGMATIKPRVCMTFRFGGSDDRLLDVSDSSVLPHLEYLAPFFGSSNSASDSADSHSDFSDSTVVPLPDFVTLDAFVDALLLAEHRCLPPSRTPLSWEHRDNIRRVADFLGMPPRLLKWPLGTACGGGFGVARDLCAVCPEWSRAHAAEAWHCAVSSPARVTTSKFSLRHGGRCLSEDDDAVENLSISLSMLSMSADDNRRSTISTQNPARGGGGASTADEVRSPRIRLVQVDAALSERTTYEPIAAVDGRWLFHSSPAPPARWPAGTRVLRKDPARAAEELLPHAVKAWLKAYPGELCLAGGAALQACCELTTRDPDIDYDLFFCGCSRERADQVLREIVSGLRLGVDYDVAYASRIALTVQLSLPTSNSESKSNSDSKSTSNSKSDSKSKSQQSAVVQFVTRLYQGMEDVLVGFDLPPCRVAIFSSDGKQLQAFCTQSFVASVQRMACWLKTDDASAWTSTSAVRAFKYYAKGFDVFMPGIRRAALKPGVTQPQNMKGLQGICLLFGIEAHFLREVQAKQRVQHDRIIGPDDVRRFVLAYRSVVAGLDMCDYSTWIKFVGHVHWLVRRTLRSLTRAAAGCVGASFEDPASAALAQVRWASGSHQATQNVRRTVPMRWTAAFDVDKLESDIAASEEPSDVDCIVLSFSAGDRNLMSTGAERTVLELSSV